MRTFHNFTLRKESWESQREAGRYNPATELVTGKHVFTLSCGDSDSVYMFREYDELIVLSLNTRYDYCGVEIFDLKTGSEIGNVFCQSEEEYTDTLGPLGLNLTPLHIAARLSACVCFQLTRKEKHESAYIIQN
jgi:hypothetical protein